jgi:hypothetical protein
MQKAGILSALRLELRDLNKNKARVEKMIAMLEDEAPAKKGKRKQARKALGQTPALAPAAASTDTGNGTGTDADREEANAKAAKKAALLAKMQAGRTKAKGPLGRKTRTPPEAAS